MKIYLILIIFTLSISRSFAQEESNFNRVWGFNNGLARVQTGDLYGFLDSSFHEVIPCKFKWAGDFNESFGLAAFEDSSCLLGFINAFGDTIVHPHYDNFYFSWESKEWDFNEFIYAKKEGKYGFINIQGKEIIPCIYDQTINTPEHFRQGLVQMGKAGKYGLLDENGIVKIDFDYEYPFFWYEKEGLSYKFVTSLKDSFFDFIDIQKFKVIRTDYTNASDFVEGFSIVEKNGKDGFVDTLLQLRIPCIYYIAKEFNNGLAPVCNIDYKWGVVDTDGDTIIDFKYDNIDVFQNGITKVELNKKLGCLNEKGEIVVPIEYDEILCSSTKFKLEHIKVCKNDSCSLLDLNGVKVSTTSYSELYFIEEFYLYTDVLINETENYFIGNRDDFAYAINRDGKEINNIGSKLLIFFYNGLALIKNENDKCGFVNKEGKLLIPFDYDYYWYYHFISGNSILKKDEKFGMIDEKGEIVIPFMYDYLEHYSEGYALAKINDAYYFIDSKKNAIKISR